jgi:uncharacterized protein
MNFTNWVDSYSVQYVLAFAGLVAGLLFGFFAQRSRFCLRAAVIEFWHGKFSERLPVWLLVFSSTVIVVQGLISSGLLDVSTAKQIANKGSLSGALIGGIIFGAGMILARGCASRLLILSANGNLRALLSGLIFAVTAQASLAGVLSPLREQISSWWVVDGGSSRDALALLGLTHTQAVLIGLIWAAAGLFYTIKGVRRHSVWMSGVAVGLSVALAWWSTYAISQSSFDVVPVHGLTFSGPSAEWLMRVLAPNPPEIGFDFGMLPAVFLGSFIAAIIFGEFKLEGFKDGYSMRRYIVGAILMGFGAMLVGGCSVGAGVSGGSIFSLTSWIALLGMWLGAGLIDRLIDTAPRKDIDLVQP